MIVILSLFRVKVHIIGWGQQTKDRNPVAHEMKISSMLPSCVCKASVQSAPLEQAWTRYWVPTISELLNSVFLSLTSGLIMSGAEWKDQKIITRTTATKICPTHVFPAYGFMQFNILGNTFILCLAESYIRRSIKLVSVAEHLAWKQRWKTKSFGQWTAS